MFRYSDPSGSDLLSRFRAVSEWRAMVDMRYSDAAKQIDSAFTWIDAVMDVPEQQRQLSTIAWKAFPILATGSRTQIDADRTKQEEYVEWAVFRDDAGNIDHITFTTEFREYFATLAAVSPTGIVTAITEINPGTQPTVEEIYGTSQVFSVPARQREILFLTNLTNNPWNNGDKGILALTHGVNSIPALFGLAAFCGIDKPGLPADQVCANVGGACVPGRQSDPQICSACQGLVRAQHSFSLVDPIGIFIDTLSGTWTVGDNQVDINNSQSSGDRWVISRNGRRATLFVKGDDELLLDGDTIESGAQVADKLFVAATVAAVSDADLPDWARIGKEHLQRPIVRLT